MNNEMSKTDQLIKANQEQEQILTLERMRELEREIDSQKEEQQKIKDIIKVDNISLNPMVKLNEAYLVELENEENQLSYQLYSEKRMIGKSNEEGLIVLDEDYIAEMDEKFGEYGAEYLIPAQNKELEPEELQNQSLDMQRKSVLEQEKNNVQDKNIQGKDEDSEQKEKNDKEKNESTLGKMEDDLGCDITSCIRIEDENFSKEVLGHQTGHKDKYIAYSKSRNTFILIGDTGSHFEEIQDICGAQGGGKAAQKQYMEYDEQGNPTEVNAPSFVMTRRDGTDGALAIDMHYGSICVSNLTPSKQKDNKYVSEEMRVGHSIRPEPDEIEAKMQREKEIEGAIAEQEKEVSEREQDAKNGDATSEDVDKAKEELEDMKSKADDDDDIYDWSTGRPIPRH